MLKIYRRKRLSMTQRARDRRRAIRALGHPLKSSQPVHHHSFTQLVICESFDYHMLLHDRESAVRDGLNPDAYTKAKPILAEYVAIEQQERDDRQAEWRRLEQRQKEWNPAYGWVTKWELDI